MPPRLSPKTVSSGSRARHPESGRRAKQRAARGGGTARENGWRPRRGRFAKVVTRDSGLYFVDAASIAQALGQNADKVTKHIRRGRLRVTNRGRAVATRRAPHASGIYFYAQAIADQTEATGDEHQDRRDHIYTDENMYWISVGRGPHMGAKRSHRPAARTGQTFRHVEHAEGNYYVLTHLFDDPDDDYWMWDQRFGGFTLPECLPPDQPPGFCSLREYTVPSPGVVAVHGETAELTVRLHGALDFEGIQHRATVKINCFDVGTAVWEGLLPHTETFEIDLATVTLNDGDNSVTIDAADSGDPFKPSIFYINDFDLSYPRAYTAVDNTLAAETAGYGAVSVGGFADPEIWVLDIEAPRRPDFLTRNRIDGVPGNYRVTFRAGNESRRFLAVNPGAALSPVSVYADLPSNLRYRHRSVDYVIVTRSDMMEAAETLADYRIRQGWRAIVIDIEDVYDDFNYGIRNADALFWFLRYAHTRWRTGPRYVVLAGEGSVDYKNYLGHGDALVPNLLAPTPDGLFPADNLYADVDGNDMIPDLAIGRLPVISPEELTSVVAKITEYEEGGPAAGDPDWTAQVMVIADEPDEGGDFSETSDAIASHFPDAYQVDRVHLDEPVPTIPGLACSTHAECVIGALNEGRAYVNVTGHSTQGSLGFSGLLTPADLASIDNDGRLPVLTALTCLVGQFGLPGEGNDSLGELLLVDSENSAAAVWAPSGLSLNHRAQILGEGFYAATFPDDPNEPGELLIGETILKAQSSYAADGVDIYLLDLYNLLGDPAMVMK